MKSKSNRRLAVGSSDWLDVIKARQRQYAQIFDCADWTPEMLSDIGHLGLVDVPMLIAEVEKNRKCEGKKRNANGDPRPNRIRPSEAALQLMVAQKTEANATFLIELRNPLAHFLIAFLAKLPLGLRLRAHNI